MRSVARSHILIVSAALLGAGAVAAAGYSIAAPLPPKPKTTVQVAVAPAAASIYQMHIVDAFADTRLARGVGAGAPVSTGVDQSVPQLTPLSVPNPDGTLPGAPLGSGGRLPSGNQATYTLQATLIGTPSLAEFSAGSDVQILHVGDHLGQRVVAEIGRGEVRFLDGTIVTIGPMTGGSNADDSSGTSHGVPQFMTGGSNAAGVPTTSASVTTSTSAPVATFAPIPSAPPTSGPVSPADLLNSTPAPDVTGPRF